MKMPGKIPVLSILLIFLALANASITAWLTDLGTQLVVQDPLSGVLQHSSCNGTINSASILSLDNSLELVTKHQPKNGTDLAGIGWFNGITTWACIFYQDKHDSLIYARYACNLNSGGFEPRDQANLSALVPPDVQLHPETNLAAVLLGEEPGIRLYFHTTDLKTHEVSFQDPRGWRYEGQLPGEPSFGNGLAAAAAGTGEITVVSVRKNDTLDIFKTQPGKEWIPVSLSLSSLESPLPAWKSNETQLALHVNAEAATSLFYIGTDNLLHQLTSSPSNPANWAIQPARSSHEWPAGHPENKGLTIASRRGLSPFRLYYHDTDKTLSELSFNSGA